MEDSTQESAVLTTAIDETQYVATDVFEWANNIGQYREDLQIELFYISKKNIPYRAVIGAELVNQLLPIFVNNVVSSIQDGAALGMAVREFEDGSAEENVLQKVRLYKVSKAVELLNWLKFQKADIEIFSDSEHDIKRMKGVVAICSHPKIKQPFYIVKAISSSQLMKGADAWMLRNDKFVKFDAEAALRVPTDNQLLIVGDDIFVFSEQKLSAFFGYNAKKYTIAEQKMKEIEAIYKISTPKELPIAKLLSENIAIINKLQKLEILNISQSDLVDHAENLGIDLMLDDKDAIIIMDGKDMRNLINLLNDDYIESNLTGLRYEIKSKKPLKSSEQA